MKVASSNFFVNDYYCGSRGQLVPLFRDLDDDGGQAKVVGLLLKYHDLNEVLFGLDQVPLLFLNISFSLLNEHH